MAEKFKRPTSVIRAEKKTAFVSPEAQKTDCIVSTTHGLVQGAVHDAVMIFRGIPYGGSCMGGNRFLPPTPVKDWEGVRDCCKNGPIAVQFGGSISGQGPLGDFFSGGEQEKFGTLEEEQSENCLVLNVLTPGADDKKRPVVFYIHGGGYTGGSGSLVLGADTFVREQDVVLVGVNHRLNIFGFLYLGAFDEKYRSSGIVGILDLVKALEWVRDNCARFGGDPNCVTIMGESGGGLKVSTLLATKSAKGLFHHAVVESGSFPKAFLSPEEATLNTGRLLRALNLRDDEWIKLCTLPAEELMRGMRQSSLDSLGMLNNVADGINLDPDVSGWFAAYAESRNVPVIIGSSEDELAIFITNALPQDITWENLREIMLAMFSSPEMQSFVMNPNGVNNKNADEVISVYRSNDTKSNSPKHLLLKILSQASHLGGGAFFHALTIAKASGAPVYHYSVSLDTPNPATPDESYAWHTAELPLQFRVVLYPDQTEISRTLSNMIAAFARSGNPSTRDLAWPPFTPEDRETMVIDQICNTKKDPNRSIRRVLNIHEE